MVDGYDCQVPMRSFARGRANIPRDARGLCRIQRRQRMVSKVLLVKTVCIIDMIEIMALISHACYDLLALQNSSHENQVSTFADLLHHNQPPLEYDRIDVTIPVPSLSNYDTLVLPRDLPPSTSAIRLFGCFSLLHAGLESTKVHYRIN